MANGDATTANASDHQTWMDRLAANIWHEEHAGWLESLSTSWTATPTTW